ncbi:MAG TPA: nitronate monooxygenase [Spirochaetota bacterium]|nr:nitronate monooxygenase [Spirochaetota bacterium]HPQ52354.1 nitronate monooxygenase [Spirochaetota bacterium]
MKTRITELFGIKYPIVLPGMSWISTPELVAAVCNAGGIGWLATGPLKTSETEAAIKRIRELTDKPFGAGATLLMPGAKENAEVLMDMQVPVINVSLGKPDDIVKRVHAYGGKVIQTVVNARHAETAVKGGVDALQVTAYEAGAHAGDVGSVCLIPAMREKFDVPIVAAGGFATGQGLAAALALGADAVVMGTRLSTTVESPLHQRTKQAHVDATVENTMFSNRFDGIWCRVLESKSAKKSIKGGMNLFKAAFVGPQIARQMELPLLKVMLGMLAQPRNMITLAHMATAFGKIQTATEVGDYDNKGVQLLGQATGLVHDIPTVAEVIERIVQEAKEAGKNVNAMLN